MAVNIIFDRSVGSFEVKSENLYPDINPIPVPDPQIVPGVIKLEIDTGDGTGFNIVYQNISYIAPNYTVEVNDIVDPLLNVTTNTLQVLLPKDSFGNAILGNYKFTYSEQYEDAQLDLQVLETIEEFEYTNPVDVSMCITSQLSCSAPLILVKDTGTYTYNSVDPLFEEQVLTLIYPISSGQANLVITELPLAILTNNVWTKGYNSIGSLTLLYTYTGYQERVKLAADQSFEVECTSMCDLYSCIKSLKAEVDCQVKGSIAWNKLQAIYEQAMAMAEQIDIATACGHYDDIPPLVNQISNLINAADCNSSCKGCTGSDGLSTQVFGYGNQSGGGSLKTTNGIIEILQTTEIEFGEGLIFTDLGDGKALVIAEVTQLDFNALQVEVDANTLGVSDNAAQIAINVTNIGLNTAALLTYLPLAGGTLTGPLMGTTATFTGEVEATGISGKGYVKVDGQYQMWDEVAAYFDVIDFITPQNVVAVGNVLYDTEILSIKRPYWWPGAGAIRYLQTTDGGTTANRPPAPVENQQYWDTDTGGLVVFVGGFWTAQGDGKYLPLIGGTMTGQLNGTVAAYTGLISAPAVPVAGGDLTNKTYVDVQVATKENSLGNPLADGDVLSSTIAGARSWITPPASGGASKSILSSFGAGTGSGYIGLGQFQQNNLDATLSTVLSISHTTSEGLYNGANIELAKASGVGTQLLIESTTRPGAWIVYNVNGTAFGDGVNEGPYTGFNTTLDISGPSLPFLAAEECRVTWVFPTPATLIQAELASIKGRVAANGVNVFVLGAAAQILDFPLNVISNIITLTAPFQEIVFNTTGKFLVTLGLSIFNAANNADKVWVITEYWDGFVWARIDSDTRVYEVSNRNGGWRELSYNYEATSGQKIRFKVLAETGAPTINPSTFVSTEGLLGSLSTDITVVEID
jgi:hypothetical protein